MSGTNPGADLAWLTTRGKEFLACDEKLAEYAKLLREKVTGNAIPSLQWQDACDGDFPFDLVGRSFKLAHRYNPDTGMTRVQVLERVVGKEDEWTERSALTMDQLGNLQPGDKTERQWPWSIHNDGVALFYKCLVEAVKAT